MEKQNVENSLNKSLALIGDRIGTVGDGYKRACKAKDIFLNLWHENGDTFFYDHLISTSEFTANEITTPSIFIASLFHHLQTNILDPIFSKEQNLLKIFAEIDEKFRHLDLLISNYIDTKKTSYLEEFKDITHQLCHAVQKEYGIDAMLVLLASKMHELETGIFREDWCNSLPEIAERSLFFLVPFTHFLGLGNWTALMEGNALKHLVPDYQESQKNYIDVIAYNRFIPQIKQELIDLINNKPSMMVIDLSWRTKGIFSIWEKSTKTGDEPRDIIGFRIIVQNKEQCLEMRNRILSRYRIRKDKHDNYFSSRNETDYQAIHIGIAKIDLPKGCPNVEIQIRDWKNHLRAEDGDLMHAIYKLKNRKYLFQNDKNLSKAWSFWLNTWLTTLRAEYTIVQMSDGQILRLKKNPKLLDLLYQIAKLKPDLEVTATRNGYELDKSKYLITGDFIEINEKKVPSPHNIYSFNYASHIDTRRWLIDNLMSKSNSSSVVDYSETIIADIFIENEVPENLQQILLNGRNYEELCLSIAENGPEYAKEKILNEFYKDTQVKMKAFFEIFKSQIHYTINTRALKYKNDQDLGWFPGKGIETDNSIQKRKVKPIPDDYSNSIISPYLGKIQTFRQLGTSPQPSSSIADDCAFCLCCNPVPGDNIIGYICPDGRLVVLHKKDCFFRKFITKNNHRRWRNYKWEHKTDREYDIGIEIFAIEEKGLQKRITDIFSNNKTKLIKTVSYTFSKNQTVLFSYCIRVNNNKEIKKLLKYIQTTPQVICVQRSIHPNLFSYFLWKFDSLAEHIWNNDVH